MSLWEELRQRKVVRTAVAYAVVAWIVLQVASIVLPALKLPEWTVTFTTILLLLGFPAALALAWSFEVVADKGGRTTSANSPPGDRSVAVLPFVNMTDDPAQAHFADGLVDDILTRLQAIGGLKVVSRQSAFAYRERSVDARTISRELDCRYVVEGSVRRIDDRMRVTVQLIDATSDQHVWAERYDRKLVDAFELQDEICAHVVTAVESRLAPASGPTTPVPASGPVGPVVADASRVHARGSRGLRERWILPALLALVAMAAVLTWTLQERSQERWAREQALPRIQSLIAKDDYSAAFDLARKIAPVIPNDPQLRALESQYAARVHLGTEPPGAKVFFRPYGSAESDWRPIGTTPLNDVPVPIGFGLWRFEHGQRETVLRVFRNPGVELGNAREYRAMIKEAFNGVDFTIPLPASGSTPRDMVLVPASHLLVSLVSEGEPVDLPAFLIDRFEVTNRQYKEFVDAGGYRDATYWQDLPYGHAATWQTAVGRFVDATGRPGPSTWEAGTYRDGTAERPVAGLSWFEAAAYARFRGKELPTVFHWYRAAYSLNEFEDSTSTAVVRHSNFGGKGTVPVGSLGGLGPYGTYDMAGNVREWLWTGLNDTRVIAGGAWNEPPYLYNQVDSASPWDRSAGNGVRCIRSVGGGPVNAALRVPIVMQHVDFASLKPVDDAAYAVLESQLQYASRDLAPKVVSLPSSNGAWKRERISLKTGYDDSRFNVQLFLPTTSRPPYQAIVYLPHGGNFKYQQTSDEFDPATTSQPIDFLLKSGRAFVVIAFDGTFERRWSASRSESMAYAERYRVRLRHARQELGRTLDYLAGRTDIDSSRIGELAVSFGAQAMMPLLAVERRLGPAVLIGGGVFPLDLPPAEEPFNYLPRVKQPILMLSGRWDIDVPPDAQEAMLRLLGTPAPNKQRLVFDAGHGWLPQNQMVRASLDWFDRQLGPVR